MSINPVKYGSAFPAYGKNISNSNLNFSFDEDLLEMFFELLKDSNLFNNPEKFKEKDSNEVKTFLKSLLLYFDIAFSRSARRHENRTLQDVVSELKNSNDLKELAQDRKIDKNILDNLIDRAVKLYDISRGA